MCHQSQNILVSLLPPITKYLSISSVPPITKYLSISYVPPITKYFLSATNRKKKDKYIITATSNKKRVYIFYVTVYSTIIE